jgi:hypothetical protein
MGQMRDKKIWNGSSTLRCALQTNKHPMEPHIANVYPVRAPIRTSKLNKCWRSIQSYQARRLTAKM